MSILLEAINVIIPIENVNRVYPGGFEQFRNERRDWFEGRFRHDEYLLREGAMNSYDAEGIIAFWEEQGLRPTRKRNGQVYWKDLCVIESLGDGPEFPCDWIVYDPAANTVAWNGKRKRS